MNDNEYMTEMTETPEETTPEETSSAPAEQESKETAHEDAGEAVLSVGFSVGEEPAEPALEGIHDEEPAGEEPEESSVPVLEILADENEPEEPAESEEKELGEEMVEQLSLLDGQLPYLEAANAPSAHRAKAAGEGKDIWWR